MLRIRQFRSSVLLILLAGFGGLLVLLGYAGLDDINVLHRIETSNNAIRQDFVTRNERLNEIRSSLYLSGTDVRDYLLDPDVAQAEVHRRALEQSRENMRLALAAYARQVRPGDAEPFHRLERDLTDYWSVLDPVFGWSPDERRLRGYDFLRREVYPRRATMLQLADQISTVNTRELDDGNRRLAELFHQFRVRVALTLAVTISLGLLLATVSIRHTLRLEREAKARYAEIEHARGELRDLSARLVETQENERRAISRELHDEVGQTLSAGIVELKNLAAAMPAELRRGFESRIEAVRRLVEGALGEVRNMALLLRPSMLDDIGLVPALRWQAREVSRRTGLRVDIAADQQLADLPDEHKTCVYRVVQEALHNCSRHADARLCRVTLRADPPTLFLSVQDDGKGFDVSQDRGLGLLGIQERVERLGGTFRVASASGTGTILSIQLPLPPTPGAAREVA